MIKQFIKRITGVEAELEQLRLEKEEAERVGHCIQLDSQTSYQTGSEQTACICIAGLGRPPCLHAHAQWLFTAFSEALPVLQSYRCIHYMHICPACNTTFC